MSKAKLASIIIVLVILIDQAIKIWVKTHMYLGEAIRFAPWAQLLFVENNGMAFGIELGSKIFLTLFRICVAAGIVWYIWKLRHRAAIPTGFVVCFAMIAAGAVGNIFDCMFYGLLFNDPMPPQVATFLPAGGGYAPFLMGRVVDMFYFPLFSFTWPQWLPVIGGQEFLFFQPVFNFADAAISVGVIALFIFYGKVFSRPEAAVSIRKHSEEESPSHDREEE